MHVYVSDPTGETGSESHSVLPERYGCEVGLSDHSGTIYAGLAAATLGTEVLEVHITFNREKFRVPCASLAHDR